MFSKTLLINLVLVMLILLGTWYTWQQLTRPANPFAMQHQPDAYATQVIIVHTDTEGNLYDELKTPLLVHYPLDDSITLSTPVFNLFLKNHESWKLTANHGKLEGDHDILQLWDRVKLEQSKGDHTSPASTLTTTTLTINLNKKTADTAAPVSIVQTNQVIHAIGLHADFTRKTVQLLSKVHGQLKPTKGTRVLTADQATGYANREGEIFKIVATGHPAVYHTVTSHQPPTLVATGNTIYYYPLRDYLEAVGNARIIRGQSYFQGPYIHYDFKKKTVGSPLSKEGHTQILLAPLQTLHS